MSEETKPEPTPLQKLQADYNQLVGRLGHCLAQQMSLKDEEENLRAQIVKVTKKAANIAKPEKTETPETTDEVKDGTNG